jgi:Zn-dependent protease
MGAGLLALGGIIGGIFVGWAKPTPVNPVNLDGGRRGDAVVAIAGPLSNLAMAAIAAIPIRVLGLNQSLRFDVLTNPVGEFVYTVAVFFVLINVFLFMFNLLPIPPLDGWKVLTGLVDARTAYNLRQYEQYGFIALILIFFVGARFLGPIGTGMASFLVGPGVFR